MRCQAKTLTGQRCKNCVTGRSKKCFQHQKRSRRRQFGGVWTKPSVENLVKDNICGFDDEQRIKYILEFGKLFNFFKTTPSDHEFLLHISVGSANSEIDKLMGYIQQHLSIIDQNNIKKRFKRTILIDPLEGPNINWNTISDYEADDFNDSIKYFSSYLKPLISGKSYRDFKEDYRPAMVRLYPNQYQLKDNNDILSWFNRKTNHQIDTFQTIVENMIDLGEPGSTSGTYRPGTDCPKHVVEAFYDNLFRYIESVIDYNGGLVIITCSAAAFHPEFIERCQNFKRKKGIDETKFLLVDRINFQYEKKGSYNLNDPRDLVIEGKFILVNQRGNVLRRPIKIIDTQINKPQLDKFDNLLKIGQTVKGDGIFYFD